MKIRNILMMCFAALLTVGMVSCGEKEKTEPENNGGNGGNGGGNTPTSLANTYWYHVDGNIMTDATVTALAFETNTLCGFGITHMTIEDTTETEEIILACLGTYTYNGSTGSIHFTDTTMTQDMGDANFSISGNTLTLNYRGTTYTLTKGDFGPDPDPDPNPDPQPGDGDGINNTVWMYTYSMPSTDPDEEDIMIVHTLAFTYGYCIYTFNGEDYETYQYMGAFTYADGSGSANLADEDGNPHNATFTVSGNTMTFTCDGTTLTLEKQSY